ncbi:hypothetical protein R2351_17935 [Mycobacteroides chelonae]|nr:hypothetical protein [Mycobacteroides chelonae]
MTTPEIDAYNERLNPLGYEIELFNGTYHLGRPGTTRELWLKSTEQVEAQISALENGNQWRLEFESGAVDINRENGDITPHDGSKSYNASIANMYGGVAVFMTPRSLGMPSSSR